ncbi:MAG: hypothetical protein BJ554DRAFT_8064 [Olpidium bornovanus]|uniref:Uncharacterized protein n=1 Tax=Olpidium bornovanus TaxID=278681 RepID=A0A8H8DIS3_9FUNG|nr:MAG: hypothetical protein BJ554DRAFT_8064 [Olpidium bornovanus]
MKRERNYRDTLVGVVSFARARRRQGRPATFEVRPDAVRFAANLDSPRAPDRPRRRRGGGTRRTRGTAGGIGHFARGPAAAGSGGRAAAIPALPAVDAAGSGRRPESGASLSKRALRRGRPQENLSSRASGRAAGLLGLLSYGGRLNDIRDWTPARSRCGNFSAANPRRLRLGKLDNLAAKELTARVLPY